VPNYSAPRTGFGGDRGAQKGTGYMALYGEWNVNSNPGRFKGVFNNFQSEMVKINRARSAEFQDLVVDLIRQRTKRKASSTGRLIQVTADKRNSSFTNASGGFTPSSLGWFVGITPYLDSSIAKYWRTIEEGSAKVWSRPFTGELRTRDGKPLWGWFGASASVSGARTLAVGPYSAPGKGSGGKFRPFYAEKPNGKRAFPKRERGLMITHEIAPMDAYRDAWAQIGPRAKSDWAVAWKESFGRVPTQKDRALNTDTRRGRRKR
jgi:hypothetical protein